MSSAASKPSISGMRHIEKDRREIVIEAKPQRFESRMGQHQVFAQRIENRFESEQVVAVVVHQQQFDALGRRHRQCRIVGLSSYSGSHGMDS